MEDVLVADLVHGALLDPEQHLDQARVAQFVLILDELPPVTVFRLPDGLLLVDGYHRLAAARRAGRSTLRANVLTGSRQDALRFATDLAMRERGLSEDDARNAIRRRSGNRWRPERQERATD